MSTSPDGQPVPVEQRLAEIHARYGPGHLVNRSIQRATPMILDAVEQVYQTEAPTGGRPLAGAGGGSREFRLAQVHPQHGPAHLVAFALGSVHRGRGVAHHRLPIFIGVGLPAR